MKYSLLFLFITCVVSGYGQQDPYEIMQHTTSGNAFPDGAWGVYSWFGLDKVSQESTPHINGTPIIVQTS